MRRHLLRGFEHAAVLVQVGGYAGGAEGCGFQCDLDAGGRCAAVGILSCYVSSVLPESVSL